MATVKPDRQSAELVTKTITLRDVKVEVRKDEQLGEEVVDLTFPAVEVRPPKAVVEYMQKDLGFRDSQIEEVIGQMHEVTMLNAIADRRVKY